MMFPDLAVGIAVAICAYTDVRERRIYNRVVGPLLAAALLWHLLQNGLSGLRFAAGGAALGMGVLLIPFLAGGIGAGDVKMMAMIGAWKGAVFTGRAILLGALVGGVLALITIIRNRQQVGSLLQSIGVEMWSMIDLLRFRGRVNLSPRSVETGNTAKQLPYGLALGMGALMAWFWG